MQIIAPKIENKTATFSHLWKEADSFLEMCLELGLCSKADYLKHKKVLTHAK